MGKPPRFDIVIWTFDHKRRTGGEEISFKNVCLNDIKPDKKYELVAKENLRESTEAKQVLIKNPNHRANKTRNLRLPNGQVRKFHIRFIKSFNGQQIIY